MAHSKADLEIDHSMGTVPHTTVTGTIGIGINDMQTCTYDEAHVMAGGRLHSHLAECRKQHGGCSREVRGTMMVCAYNQTHHVHSSVLEKHYMICDGFYKASMDRQTDPPSMKKSYKRYDETKRGNTPMTKKVEFSELGSDWGEVGEENEEKQLRGITIKDLDGVVMEARTKSEFKSFQSEIAKKLIKLKLKEMDGNVENDSGLAVTTSLPQTQKAKDFCMRDLDALPTANAEDRVKYLLK